jgi:pyruvate/2-oxoglutarate dehydrogenase complex dihydrolipoamide dehydrogenase (E3) component
MTDILTPDICVIGAGSGGLSVAAAAAAFGVPVVLIEKGKMGGDCLNAGCIPSKALIAAARRAHEARTGGAFGVEIHGVDIAYDKVHGHIHDVIAAIAPNDSAARFAGLGVKVLQTEARFVDNDTVAAGDKWIVKARRFVIATGSSPAIPSIPGLDKTPYLTNETIFDLKQCPSHLIVIGAGPVGLELAQAYRRLGAAVTVLEAARPLAKEDPECSEIVLDQLRREGIALRTGVKIARTGRIKGGGVNITLESPESSDVIEGSHLLIAAGRKANVAGLDLDKAGVRTMPSGILVNKRLRTTNKRIYAIGDAAGGMQFTHLANYHAGLVIRNALFRLPVSANEDVVPRVTFTEPELAHVGLAEADARQHHRSIRILRWPFHENDRAQTERNTCGHVKVVTTKRGRILGATIVGAQAGELLAAWALAIHQRVNIRAMTGVVLPYPTRAEAGKRAAIDFFTPGLTSPLLRRIIILLRRFG